jgi:hypothetical protein
MAGERQHPPRQRPLARQLGRRSIGLGFAQQILPPDQAQLNQIDHHAAVLHTLSRLIATGSVPSNQDRIRPC